MFEAAIAKCACLTFMGLLGMSLRLILDASFCSVTDDLIAEFIDAETDDSAPPFLWYFSVI